MEDDVIKWTADTRLELAVEIGEFQRAGGWVPKGIERAIERHGSGGERSRFVAAKHIQTAEVLNRGEMLDDDLLTRHGDGAFGKRHRRNHGQELGCQANCQRNRKQQRLKRIAMAYNADDNQEENEEEDRSRKELAEISQALIEGGLFRACGEASRNIAKGGPRARRDDLGGCRSAHDGGAQKDHVARIRFGRGGLSGRFFFGGERFAR